MRLPHGARSGHTVPGDDARLRGQNGERLDRSEPPAGAGDDERECDEGGDCEEHKHHGIGDDHAA
jgi:hypothetical protein